MRDRIRNQELEKKIIEAEEAADLVEDGMTIGCSGFTPSGYPKAVPLALYERVKSMDDKPKISLLTGASVGKELDGKLVEAGCVKRRFPYQSNKEMRNLINKGDIAYSDIHLSHFPQQVRYGYYGDIDLAIIEAVAITEDGNIIPSTSVGASPAFVEKAKNVIVELNLNKSLALEGYHDIYQLDDPPNRKPIPLSSASDRIGNPYIELDNDKLQGIVLTELEDDISLSILESEKSKQIAGHIIEFLKYEVKNSRLPDNLLPLQSGVGKVANSVLSGLCDSPFNNIDFYSEVIQDSVFDLIDCGKIRVASGTSITPSPEGYKHFLENIERYKEKIILRPQEISNNPEIIRRLGSIAINTAVEVDMYGNVNSSNIMGTNIMNGIGGSGDFTRNAYLSVFVTTSIAKGGDISSIVPMVAHVDHTDHDVDVIVTEQGLADLRGLSARGRAREIIENCAHPDFRNQLKDYFNKAQEAGGNIPHRLEGALSWHRNLMEGGTMKA